VIPHQCLGSVWSRRDKGRDRDAATVVATIEQFNAVSYRVISTVLVDAEAKNSTRGRIITAWVDIAQELRVLKNFSSLKAIVSGLQSNPVFRLKKAWSSVPREKLEIFEELARIFRQEHAVHLLIIKLVQDPMYVLNNLMSSRTLQNCNRNINL
jgi:ral guanine nucleotide dissociation stimulator-like 1